MASEVTADSAHPESPATTIVVPRNGVLQVGERVAESVVGGFTGSPALLLIVILNVAMILAAAYYLARLEETRAASVQRIGDLLATCIGDTVPTSALDMILGGRRFQQQQSPNHP